MSIQKSDTSEPGTTDDSPGRSISFNLANQAPSCDQQTIDWVIQHLEKITTALQLPSADLSLVIVEDQQMSQLHQQFSNVPGTTDVLTFDLRPHPLTLNDPPSHLEGEIIICFDEATRRAKEMDHPVKYELLLYFVHGILHLLGYDDHDENDHRIMHQREDQLLTQIGVGPIYKPQHRKIT